MTRKWLALVAICLGYFMVILDVTVVTVAVPAIGAGLGTGMTGLQWVVDGYTLAFAGLLLFAGGLGDRLGGKPVFVGGLVVFTVASIACGAAPGTVVLVGARLVQGVGAALMVPASLSLLQATYGDQASRARTFGIWGTIAGVAAGAGPVVGGVLVTALGWRSVFFVNLPIGLAALYLTFHHVRPAAPPSSAHVQPAAPPLPTHLRPAAPHLPDPHARPAARELPDPHARPAARAAAPHPADNPQLADTAGPQPADTVRPGPGRTVRPEPGGTVRAQPVGPRSRSLDVPAQVVAAGSIAALVGGLIQAGATTWTNPCVLALFGVFAAGTVLFLFLERRSGNPMLPLHLFRNGPFSASAAVGLLMNLGFYGFLFIAPLYFQHARGFTPLQTGLALIPTSAMAALSSGLAGNLTARAGPRRPMLIGLATAAAGLLAWYAAQPGTPYPALIIPMAAIGFGTAFTMPASTAAIMHAAPDSLGGAASAVFNTARQIGSALGVALFGTFSATHLIPGLHTAALTATAAFLTAAALTMRFVKQLS